jgi:hypothetical protein
VSVELKWGANRGRAASTEMEEAELLIASKKEKDQWCSSVE